MLYIVIAVLFTITLVIATMTIASRSYRQTRIVGYGGFYTRCAECGGGYHSTADHAAVVAQWGQA